MNDDSRRGDKDGKRVVATICLIVAYPIHWAFRVIARTLLFAVLVLVLLLVPIVILIAWIWQPELLNTASKALQSYQMSLLIAVLVGTGILSTLCQEALRDVWKSLLEIFQRIRGVLSGRWFPGLNIAESLSMTWKHYGAKIWPSAVAIFTDVRRLVVALSIVWIIVSLSYLIQKDERDRRQVTRGWRESVSAKLERIEREIDSLSTIPPVSDPFKMGDKFSLVYREGNLITKEGICPGGSNLESLKAFRTQISVSLKGQDPRRKLRVKGFASVAPVTVFGDTSATQSNLRNLEIANQRAEAVIYYLTMADPTSYTREKCKDALDTRHIWNHVTTSDSIWRVMNFDVIYNPWKKYNDMVEFKPANDALQDGTRQRDLEFLNRSVQIIIE